VTRALALALLLLLATAGCRSLTGRSPGQWVDDHATTARVKTRLAREAASTVTRVHVDTYEGVVYLTGGVASAEAKQRVEAIAGEVPSVRLVVNNLHVTGEESVAASPRTDVPEGRSHPVRARYPGIARLDLETGTPAWTRYAAYDPAGARVATVYAVRDARQAVGDLAVGGRPVDHIALVPAGGATHVVLWHVSRDAMSGLR
jgi:hyperosmotically inducible protein